MMILFTALAVIGAYLIYLYYRKFFYWQRQGIPALPYIVLSWVFKPSHLWQEEAAKLHGKVFGGYMVNRKILILNDAKLARDLSIKEMHKFPIRNSFHSGSSNISQSLFFLEANEQWKRIRNIVTPAFTSGKLKQMMTPIDRISQNFIEHLRPEARSGRTFDIKKFVGGFAMDVIASCAYGIELDSVSQPNHPVVVNAKRILNVDLSFSFIMSIFFPGVAKFLSLEPFNKKAVDYFDDLTFKIVEQRLKNSAKQNPDLLGLMIESANVDSKEDQQNGSSKGLSKEEMSGQGILFFIAGFDTTHATFDHVIYFLTQYPEWQDKLYQELVELQDEISYDTLKNLKILNAVINETLRLRPPLIEFHREAKDDCELLDTGIKIPKDTLIIIQPYSIHRNADYFPDPLEFKPERFLDKETSPENHFAYAPFGFGQRLCVGMRFAQNELRIGLAKFILNYKVEAEKGLELEYYNGSILMSAKQLPVSISER